ncbi:MAG: MerR family transcriptional regulator [Chloroflexaceae bacterium]|jgi:DNA-binding transcriptional MerR regulator|nr:MerR family transcriptional regulator [Chloroflexaceae bacterium]
MFRIGEFSTFTRVSVKMLRHYDEIGLLKAGFVDPATSYRYYTADQLPRLNQIIALKDLGISLEQIGELLRTELAPTELRGMLKLRKLELEGHIQREQQRLALLEARLSMLEQPVEGQGYAVVQRSLAPLLVASVRQHVPEVGQPITNLFEELESLVSTHQARAASSPLTLFHNPGYREEELEVEVAVPLKTVIPASARIAVYELPAVPQAACVVYTGSYAHSTTALNALLRWVEANRCHVAGPLREVYLRFGADDPDSLRLPPAFLTNDSEQFVTELQLPVQPHT